MGSGTTKKVCERLNRNVQTAWFSVKQKIQDAWLAVDTKRDQLERIESLLRRLVLAAEVMLDQKLPDPE